MPKEDEACLAPAVTTKATVETSYGKSYRVETWYRTPGEAAAFFDNDAPSLLVVEGPLAWVRDANGERLGSADQWRFTIGHQFHALAFRFDEIFYDVAPVKAVAFRGESYRGRKGVMEGGGKAMLALDADDRPTALILNPPNETPMEITYEDWRDAPSGSPVPWRIVIAHKGDTFDYRFTSINFSNADAADFQSAYTAPAIDEVGVYRLHRGLLAAHCRGDAEMLAALTAPEGVVASRGDLMDVSRADTLLQFQSVFARSLYTSYADLQPPVIEVAKDGEIGWAVVNVRPEGTMLKTGEPFSGQWAWAILARKIDGVWLSVGNISSAKEE